jgi:hypothetical protein
MRMRIRDLEIFLTLDLGSGMEKVRIRDKHPRIATATLVPGVGRGPGKLGSALSCIFHFFLMNRSGGDGRRNSEIRQSIPVPGLGEICEEEEDDIHLDQEVFR